jgi:COX assembly protein 1
MAVMAAPPPTQQEEVPRLPMPSRNPLPLSSGQEAQVRELYHARVRGYCAAEIKR